MRDARRWGTLVVGLVLGATAGTVLAHRQAETHLARHTKAARGWAPVELVVAAEDVSGTQTLQPRHLARRAVPEQFVSASFVRAEDAHHLVGAPLLFPLKAGAPVTWASLASALPPDACEALHEGITGELPPD